MTVPDQHSDIDNLSFLPVLEAVNDAVLVFNANGVIKFVNNGARNLLDSHNKRALTNRPVKEAFLIKDPESRMFIPPDTELVFASQERMCREAEGEYNIQNAEGGECFVYLSAVNLSGNGKQEGAYILKDLTERVREQKELKQSENILYRIIDTLPHQIFLKDHDNRFLMVNETVAEMHNTSKEAFTGKRDEDILLNKEEADFFRKVEQQVIGENREMVIPEEQLTDANGDIHILQTTKIPFYIESRGETGVLGIAIDITERKNIEKRLEESEKMLRQMIDLVPHAIFLKDNQHRFIVINQAMANLHNTSIENIIGRTDEDIFRADEAEAFRNVEERVLENREEVFVPEEYLTDFKGKTRIMQTTKLPFYIHSRKEWGILGIAYEITEKKLAEARIREIENRFRNMVANIPGIFYRSRNDAERTMEYISDFVEITTGYPASDFVNNRTRTFNSIIHKDDRKSVLQSIKEALENRTAYIIEYRIITRNGGVKWVYEKGKGVFGDDNELKYLDGAIFDITDRKELQEEQIRMKLEHQKSLMNAVVETQERERKNIAEDLHDGLGQMLTAARMNVEAYRSLEDKEQPEAGKMLEKVADFLHNSIYEVRNITGNLLPAILSDFGLVVALDKLCENMTAVSDTTFYFYSYEINDKLDENIEMNLYRVSQEITNNIVKHAEATTANIQLFKRGKKLILQIDDDGKGFDLTKKQENGSGLGLKSIEHRVELINGTLDIDTVPGKGCSFSIIVKL